MNNSIEPTLRAWRPNPPSPGLRSRIFASETAPSAVVTEGLTFDFGAMTRWLAPVAGCFMLAVASLNTAHPQAPLGEVGHLSAQQFAFSVAARHSDMNNLPATPVEWTFGRRSTSNSDSFAGSETNLLRK